MNHRKLFLPLAILSLGIVGCDPDDAGDAVEEGIENTEEAVEEVGDEIDDAVDDNNAGN